MYELGRRAQAQQDASSAKDAPSATAIQAEVRSASTLEEERAALRAQLARITAEDALAEHETGVVEHEVRGVRRGAGRGCARCAPPPRGGGRSRAYSAWQRIRWSVRVSWLSACQR